MKRVYVADLFVDDPRGLEQILQAAAGQVGVSIQVTTFQDGYDIYQHVLDSPPDLVLLGFLLPALSGPAACRLIKYQARLKHIPVYLTAWPSELDLEARLIGTGADGFLPKPWTLEQMAPVLTSLQGVATTT